MAFLDNSGDIILDAVLTDAGRQRLARGNFKIVKFALGDEEINYRTFNSTHPSGSAFYDLEVMQTPILEAFTNNASMMKSRLMTMTRNNILYLPVLKLNNDYNNRSKMAHSPNCYILIADLNTESAADNDRIDALSQGILRGYQSNHQLSRDRTNHVAIDQGIDSVEGGITWKTEMPSDLVETAYLVRMDHRLMTLHSIANDTNSTTAQINQFIDDDGIATYFVALGDGNGMGEAAPAPNRNSAFSDERFRRSPNQDSSIWDADVPTDRDVNEIFKGPLGSILRFYPRASLHVQDSQQLFNEIGSISSSSLQLGTNGNDTITLASGYKYIDTLINVVGVTTGYSIDVPVRIIKKP